MNNNQLFNMDEVVALVRNNNNISISNNQVPAAPKSDREKTIDMFKAQFGDNIQVIKCKYGTANRLNNPAFKHIPIPQLATTPLLKGAIFSDWNREPQVISGMMVDAVNHGNYSYIITKP